MNKALWQYVFGNNGIKPKLEKWHDLSRNQTNGNDYLQKLLGDAA
jgi:hypothetical protein